MSSRLNFAVRFAVCCDRYNIAPTTLRDLIAATDKAFRAGERYANSGTERDSIRNIRTGALVERIADTIGLTTTWPGLYPLFTDGAGNPVYMPHE